MTALEDAHAHIGDTLTCPGCGEMLTLDWADGWRNDNGFTCNPPRTTHSQHIFTAATHRTQEGRNDD